MRYPRAVLSPLPRGEHLGRPGDAAGQARILGAALELLVSAREPSLVELPPEPP